MIFLYTVTLGAVILISVSGWSYFSLPLLERPRHEMYTLWKPGGDIGHAYGVIGSLLLVSLLGYVFRKRVRFMQEWGNIRQWLDIHIWMGITGPLLILFHTTFKFGGIVAVSFWSMMAVAISGVLGRYLYMQIPRTINGNEVSRRELEDDYRRFWIEFESMAEINDDISSRVKAFVDISAETAESKSWTSLPKLVINDLLKPLEILKLRSDLKNLTSLPTNKINKIIKMAVSIERLNHRLEFLNAAQVMLHHWHIIHRPFAAVMYLIMCIHIVVAVIFGYRWIF